MKLADVDLSIKPEVDEMTALWAAEGSGAQPDPDDKSDETKVDETAVPADDKPADDKPADDKPADDKPADDTPAPVEVDFTPPAWISLLPQEAQAQAVKDFRNSRSNVKAQSTRVSELTKHLMATRQELEKAKKLSTVLPSIDLTSDKALEELAKEFPEAATALKSVAEKLTQQVTAHNASISNQLVQAQESQANAIASEIAQLTEADKAEQRRVVEQFVPDAPQIVRDPAFVNWLTGQSPAVQAMIHSPHAGDNITLFNLYKGSVRKPEPAAAKLAEFAELPTKGGKPKAAELRDDPNADPTDYWKTYIDNSKGR